MKRKIISILTAASMLMSLIPLIGAVPVSAAGTDASGIEIGDYVQMGTYDDMPILWRCVAFEKITGYDTNGNPITDSTQTFDEYKDGYLPLMLADTILCQKAFDAKGDDKTGSHIRGTATNGTTDRVAYGSNYWADSNIRCWLNSDADAGNVEWLCGNAPITGKVNGRPPLPYDQEAGFLTNFSDIEKAAIKTVTQKSVVTVYDKYAVEEIGTETTGTETFSRKGAISEITSNYTTAFSHNVTDTMFLPDVQQISNVYANAATLGEDYFKASSSITDYWLRTPDNNCYSVCSITYEGICTSYYVCTPPGIRPSFYLNTAATLAGSGTAEAPYTIEHQHNLVKHDAVPATCTTDGTGEYYTCEGENSCGKMFSDAAGTTEISEIPTLTAPGHSWGSWYITSEPTLTATGEAERVCENNGEHTEEAVLPVLTNTDVWTAGKLKPATCEKSGSLTYNSIYGNVTITLPQTGHSWGSWTITTEPTSTTGGTAERICTRNSTHIDTVDLPDLTNTAVWTLTGTQAATTTEDGWKEYTSDYGTVTVIIPAIGHTHDWGEWELTTEPTETKTGIATRVCKTNAEHKETKNVPVLTDEDVWKAVGGSVPTCTTEGATDYYSDEYGTVTATIPATGHSWGSWYITSNPTFTAKGEAERVCENNGEHTETAELPVLTNTSVWTVGTKVEPTETTDGSQTYTSEYGDVTVVLPKLKYSIKYESGTNAVITVTKTDTYAVIFAAYDSEGKLISLEVQTKELNKGENTVTPKTFNAAGAANVKIMLWDSINNMKPLCEPYAE